MHPDPVDPTDLIHELRRGALVPERYSRLSPSGRAEPVLVGLLLAATAILLGITLGGGSIQQVGSGALRVWRERR